MARRAPLINMPGKPSCGTSPKDKLKVGLKLAPSAETLTAPACKFAFASFFNVLPISKPFNSIPTQINKQIRNTVPHRHPVQRGDNQQSQPPVPSSTCNVAQSQQAHRDHHNRLRHHDGSHRAQQRYEQTRAHARDPSTHKPSGASCELPMPQPEGGDWDSRARL